MSEEDFASKISSETPWWAKAPVWLAAGIVGVPSLMAIGAGYFIAGSVTKQMHGLQELNRTEISKLEGMEKNWEVIRRNIAMGVEIQLRTCVHQAADQKERDDCLKGMSAIK
jgi:hypothetical protein